MQGKFIVFDGPDGSGKTTQKMLLKQYLESKGLDVVTSKNPSDGRIGILLSQHYLKRSLGLLTSFLFAADREENLREVVQPALKKGSWILQDRYSYSSLAYQQASGMDLHWLIGLHRYFPRPDIAFIFKLDAETCMKRIQGDNRSRIVDYEKREFLENVIRNYLHLPEALKDHNIKIIDGSRSPEAIQKEIRKEIDKLLA